MKEGWTYKKLGEVCNIICGQDYKTVECIDGQYPIYGSGGIMGYASEYRCPANSVIIGRKGNINNPLFVETNFWNVDTAFGIVPNQSDLVPKFFYYFSKNYDFTIHDVSVTIPSLRRTDLLKITIPLPPLSVQQSIVSELDMLSGLIAKHEEQLKAYDELAQSIFYDMFGDPVENEKGWEVKKFNDLATFKNGLNFHPEKGGSIIKCIGVGDFQERKEITNFDSIQSLSISKTIDEGYFLKNGDIIIVRSNGSKELVGRSMIVYPNNELITFSGFCIRCRIVNHSVLPIILHRILSHRSTMNVMRQEGRGCNISNINQKILSSLPIIIPPLSLQTLFAEKIEAIERQKERIRQSMAEVKTLFDSRMDYYFNSDTPLL